MAESAQYVRGVLELDSNSESGSIEDDFLASRSTWNDKVTLLLWLLVFTGIGVAFGCIFAGWEFVTALYFMVQVVTTIGYGDLGYGEKVVQIKLFLCVFVPACLVILAYLLNKVQQAAFASAEAFVERNIAMIDELAGNRAMDGQKSTPGRKLLVATILFVIPLGFGTIFYRVTEHCSCGFGVTVKSNCTDSTYEECINSESQYIKSLGDAFYMSVITLSTVGLGDYTPRTHLGRYVSIPWMLLGVFATANVVDKLSHYLFERRLIGIAREDLDEKTIQQLDKNGDGFLDRHEYFEYVLMRNGLVSADMFNHLNTTFDVISDGKPHVSLDTLQRGMTQLGIQSPVKTTTLKVA